MQFHLISIAIHLPLALAGTNFPIIWLFWMHCSVFARACVYGTTSKEIQLFKISGPGDLLCVLSVYARMVLLATLYMFLHLMRIQASENSVCARIVQQRQFKWMWNVWERTNERVTSKKLLWQHPVLHYILKCVRHRAYYILYYGTLMHI